MLVINNIACMIVYVKLNKNIYSAVSSRHIVRLYSRLPAGFSAVTTCYLKTISSGFEASGRSIEKADGNRSRMIKKRLRKKSAAPF